MTFDGDAQEHEDNSKWWDDEKYVSQEERPMFLRIPKQWFVSKNRMAKLSTKETSSPADSINQ